MVSLLHLNGDPVMTRMAAVAVMMSIFWITEAIPLAATALLPLALFPLLGIDSSKHIAAQYMNSTVFLLIGGFLLALAMQRWNLHKRVALNVLSVFGGHPVKLLFGFMLATAGLSMWISNTATTLVILPIALAIQARYQYLLNDRQKYRFNIAVLLSIAYSASIGGMMSLIGTAPNLVFASYYENLGRESIGFTQWMLISLPIGGILILALAALMGIFYLHGLPGSKELKQVVVEEKNALGTMRKEEKVVLGVFCVTALLWITRKGLQIGDTAIAGWGELLTVGKLIDDGTIAIVMSLLLFFLPGRDTYGKKTTILNEKVFQELPWSVVILFGGGFALANGFTASGLSNFLALKMEGFETFSLPFIILSVTAGMSMMTELTSNTATTQMVLPIINTVSDLIHVEPSLLMLPVTLAASCAFMFPVATPPNAIIFASGKIRVVNMITLGIPLNIVAVFTISFMCYWLVPIVFFD